MMKNFRESIVSRTVVAGLIIVLSSLSMAGCPDPSKADPTQADLTQPVPDVVGLTQSDAAMVFMAVSLGGGGVTQQYSDTVAEGSVISQNPVAGARVSPGASIALVISQGPEQIVPDVVGLMQSDAELAIAVASLGVGIITSGYSDTIPVGSVISQEPAAGERVSSGSLIAFVVAQSYVGDTYFVDIDSLGGEASDSNPGTESQPWSTIQKAVDTMIAGDTVFIRAGIYYEQVKPRRSGDIGRYITFQNYPEERPVLDGTDVEIPTWDGLFEIRAVDHIKVIGMEIRNAGHIGKNVLGIQVMRGDQIILKDLQVHDNLYGNVICVDGDTIEVSNCTSYGAGEGNTGFYFLRFANARITNCVAYSNGGEGGGLAQGFLFNSGGYHTVTNCISYMNARDGFDVSAVGEAGGTHDIEFINCVATENGEDGFGINSFANNVVFRNCLSHGNGSVGFNVYQGAHDILFDRTTIAGNPNGAFRLNGQVYAGGLALVERVEIKNSIIASESAYTMQVDGIYGNSEYPEIVDLVMDYNNWYSSKLHGAMYVSNFFGDNNPDMYTFAAIEDGSWFAEKGHGEHSFLADPEFANPTDPSGPDGLFFTSDDGLLPTNQLTLQGGEDGLGIGYTHTQSEPSR